ncbi:hypothetical protein COU54_02650 [Candidatus Pacearchaeota archaeon CG10_big_fil_rev_8_21_14_0_10_31_24]|nr:MAG: hypothetical protein COU54_02650 [Candidatus Pacearchaeota archaeon CG10_big_fil_rev_8_21_14_0_10_31_24]
MDKTILVDGMGTIYNEEFQPNEKLLTILNSFTNSKILVVNKFREKGSQALGKNISNSFSLEEQGINKNDPEYFKLLMEKFDISPENLIYFEHNSENVETASKLGIKSIHYTGNNNEIKLFLESNL